MFDFGITNGAHQNAINILNDGTFYWQTAPPTDQLYASRALSLNTWYQIALVRVNGVKRIYINGVQDPDTSVYTNTITNPQALWIGERHWGTGNPFNGIISNFQVYNTALSAAQVQQLYQEGIASPPVTGAGLVGWWPLNGDTNDYANFNTGYNSNVIFTAQNYTLPRLSNAYSISTASVLLPLLNYSSGLYSTYKVGVYSWK
jgi:hypothetical protein